MPSLLIILAALILIPAGLAGVASGLSGLLTASRETGGGLELLLSGLAALWPWCQALACLAGGIGLLALTGLAFWSGLQFRG